MKSDFQNTVAFMGKRLEKRPSAWDAFLKETTSTFLRAFDEGSKTVWVSCYAFPMELLWAFDVVPFDFEIACNSLRAALKGRGSSVMAAAEREGYSRNICSFYRLVLGAQFMNILPRGDLFLTSSYYCNGKAKTNEAMANYRGKKSVLLDVPNEISGSSIKYVASQLREITIMLEEITGDRLDPDRLKKSISWSNRARASYQEVNELMKVRPCPWEGYKACMLAISGSLFWGSRFRDEIHRMLISEMKERIDGNRAYPEDYRVLWSPWVPVQPTDIFETLSSSKVSVPVVEKTRVYWSEIDEMNPFEGLALKTLQNPFLGTADKRAKGLLELAGEYEVDGAIHFSTPACYHETGATRIIADAFKEKGIPFLDLDGDMTDERNYSPEKTMAKLSSFLEILRG